VEPAGVRSLVSPTEGAPAIEGGGRGGRATEDQDRPVLAQARATSYGDALRSGEPDRYTGSSASSCREPAPAELSGSEPADASTTWWRCSSADERALDRSPDEIRAEIGPLTGTG
jgi:hypothetical protein